MINLRRPEPKREKYLSNKDKLNMDILTIMGPYKYLRDTTSDIRIEVREKIFAYLNSSDLVNNYSVNYRDTSITGIKSDFKYIMIIHINLWGKDVLETNIGFGL